MERFDSNNRLDFLFIDRDEPRHPGFSTPRRVASPLIIPKAHSQRSPPRPHPPSITSPTLSSRSTVSTTSRRSGSRRQSSGSSATSVTNTPPWAPPTLNQQITMAPYYGYDLPCEFVFQGCNLRFHPENFEEWISHTASHFVNVPPPAFAICTFCDDENNGCFRSNGDLNKNWRDRMIHIGEHFQNLQPAANLRPDHWVIEYMWFKGLMSREDYVNAMRHTERPYCDGLVPLGTKTREVLKKEERESKEVFDQAREDREMRRSKNAKGRQTTHERSRRYHH